MDRRVFLVGAAAGGLWSMTPPTKAQRAGTSDSAKLARLGRLSVLSAEADGPLVEALRTGLRDLGWIEGKNFTMETLFAEGKPERMPELAAELVARRVDIILVGSNPATLIVKSATTTIPVVMVTTADPVGAGIIESLARPGGNITGVTAPGQASDAKRLELLKQAVPGIARIAVLVNPASPHAAPFAKESTNFGRALGLEIRLLEAHDPDGIEKAFAVMANERVGALAVLTDVWFVMQRKLIVELATLNRIPVVYGDRDFVDAGGLMFYGASLADMYRRSAAQVYKILNGAVPADMPVEQTTNFRLVINLNAAQAIGLPVPKSLLLRADEVLR